MSLNIQQIANIDSVGYLSSKRISFQFTIREIHEAKAVLEYELSTLFPIKVSQSPLAKVLWDSYKVIEKRYDKLYYSHKRKGSITLPMAHWFTLYYVFIISDCNSQELRNILDQIHQLIISYSHKGILIE